MPEVAFVMSERQHYPLRELAGTLGYELELQSVPCSLHVGGFPAPGPSRVYILMDPYGYVGAEGDEALPSDAILHRTIFLCAEPPPSRGDDEHIALLQRAGAVFVLDQRSVLTMHRLGIPARLVRPGYSKSLDRFDAAADRPIDVMFLGAHSLRRTKYLSCAARILARYNCLLQISTGTPSSGNTTSYLADSRWPLLAQTKVVISLHRDDGLRFDWRGALDAIHTGAVVVTEPSSGVAPLVPGEHLLVASARALPYVVEDLLGDEDRLARLRSQAYERIKAWIPYALPVAVLRAAVVELVGEPLPSAVWLERVSVRPEAPDTAPHSALADRPPNAEPSVRDGGLRIEVAHRTKAWEARRAPMVTAVIALGNDAQRVVPTLDSLAHSKLRDFELVLVAGRSGDESQMIAADWVVGHPRIPAQLVVSEDTSLGAARNVGLDFARGPFLLILDPGQELYPRCLDVLVGTLEAMPEMAFVYPIHQVTGAPEEFVNAGGDYLLSYFGWDPGSLRSCNYIHAPALVRTDRLRQLGGFAAEPSLVGFEDYDLWCRMAELGWRGQLVPQELTRRAESGSSKTLSTLHPSPGDATAALTERAPGFMSGAFGAR
jgi:Glycosyl transferase family 2